MRLRYLIPIFLLLLLLICPAQAWYQLYCFRQEHNITGSSTWGGSLTNYEVMFVVNTGYGSSSGSTIYLNGHSESDLDDLRFTDTSDNLLEYWIESTSNPYNVWVKMPTVTTGTNQVYVYYGNSSASAYSNGWNVFNLYDHFDGSSLNGTTWTQVFGSVSVGSSVITVTGTDSAYQGIYSDINFGVNTSFRSRTKMSTHASGNVAEAYTDVLITSPYQYHDGFYQYNDGTYRNSHYTKNGGTNENSAGLTSDNTAYHIYDEHRNATTASIYQRDGTAEKNTAGLPTGSIPVNIWVYYPGSVVYCDWFIVRDYRGVEPAHSDWSAEVGRPAPVADFTSNVTEVFPLDYIQFTDTTTNTPTAWDWYFPNGVDSHVQNPSYTFDIPIGNMPTWFNVSLNASHCGGYDWENKTNYFIAYPLNASFTVNVTSGCGSLNVNATSLTDNGTADWWDWYINDYNYVSGASSVDLPFGEEAQHGQVCYNVSLNASNVYSYDWENKTNYICVNGINASFTVDKTQNCTPFSVQFTDASDICSATNWSWDFGNGNTSILQNPLFEYTTSGVYDVTLRVFSNSTANYTYCNSWDEIVIPSLINSTDCSVPVTPTPTPTPTPTTSGGTTVVNQQPYIPASGANASGLVYPMLFALGAGGFVFVIMLGLFVLLLSRRRRRDEDDW